MLFFECDQNGNYSFQKVLLLEFIQTNLGKNSRLLQYVLKSTTIPRKGQCPHIEYMRHIRCLFAVTVESLVRLAFLYHARTVLADICFALDLEYDVKFSYIHIYLNLDILNLL